MYVQLIVRTLSADVEDHLHDFAKHDYCRNSIVDIVFSGIRGQQFDYEAKQIHSSGDHRKV